MIGRAAATATRHTSYTAPSTVSGNWAARFNCLVSQVDSAHHLHRADEMSTSLQETGEKHVRIAWSNGATQDDDNHARRDPMNLSPYASSGCLRQEQHKEKKMRYGHKSEVSGHCQVSGFSELITTLWHTIRIGNFGIAHRNCSVSTQLNVCASASVSRLFLVFQCNNCRSLIHLCNVLSQLVSQTCYCYWCGFNFYHKDNLCAFIWFNLNVDFQFTYKSDERLFYSLLFCSDSVEEL